MQAHARTTACTVNVSLYVLVRLCSLMAFEDATRHLTMHKCSLCPHIRACMQYSLQFIMHAPLAVQPTSAAQDPRPGKGAFVLNGKRVARFAERPVVQDPAGRSLTLC